MVLKKQERPEVQVFDLPDDINPEKSAINKSIKSQNLFKCLRCEDTFGVIEDLAKHLKLVHDGKTMSQLGLTPVKISPNKLRNVRPFKSELRKSDVQQLTGNMSTGNGILKLTSNSIQPLGSHFPSSFLGHEDQISSEKFDLPEDVNPEKSSIEALTPKKVACARCQSTFENFEDLTKHFSTAHGLNPALKPEIFKEKQKIFKEKQKDMIRMNYPIKNPDMFKRAMTKADLLKNSIHRNSSQVVEAMKIFKCFYCTSQFEKLPSLKIHIKIVHKEKYKITDYAKVISTDIPLKEKPILHRQNSIDETQLNQKSFKRPFENHSDDDEIQVISDSEQSLTITLPQKVPQKMPINHSKKSVDIELVTDSSKSKAGKCTECNLTFELMTDLKDHFATVHWQKGPSDSLKSLPKSATKSQPKSATKSHPKSTEMVEATLETTMFQCPFCESRFMWKNNIISHIGVRHKYKDPNVGFKKVFIDGTPAPNSEISKNSFANHPNSSFYSNFANKNNSKNHSSSSDSDEITILETDDTLAPEISKKSQSKTQVESPILTRSDSDINIIEQNYDSVPELSKKSATPTVCEEISKSKKDEDLCIIEQNDNLVKEISKKSPTETDLSKEPQRQKRESIFTDDINVTQVSLIASPLQATPLQATPLQATPLQTTTLQATPEEIGPEPKKRRSSKEMQKVWRTGKFHCSPCNRSFGRQRDMERHNNSKVHLSTIQLGYPVRSLQGSQENQKAQEGPNLTLKNDGMGFDKSIDANEIVKIQFPVPPWEIPSCIQTMEIGEAVGNQNSDNSLLQFVVDDTNPNGGLMFKSQTITKDQLTPAKTLVEGNDDLISSEISNDSPTETSAPVTSNMKRNRETSTEKRYKCPHCESTFSFKHNMKVHARKYHPELFENTDFSNVEVNVILDEPNEVPIVDKTRFQCPSCDCDYSRKALLNKHIEKHHENDPNAGTPEKRYQCPSCDYKPSRKEHLKRHIKGVHKSDDFSQIVEIWVPGEFKDLETDLSKDSVEFQNDQIATDMEKVNEPEKIIENQIKTSKFKCVSCDSSYSKKDDLISHIKENHASIWSLSNDSNKKESNDKEGKEKSENIGDNMPILQKFDENDGIEDWQKVDMRSVHEGKKSFNCSICSMHLSSKRNLENHVAGVHEGKKPYSCLQCTKSFYGKLVLKQHIETVHEAENNKLEQPELEVQDKNKTVEDDPNAGNLADSFDENFHGFTDSKLEIDMEFREKIISNHIQNDEQNENFLVSNSSQQSGASNKKSFQCPKCVCNYSRPENLKGHMITFHQEKHENDSLKDTKAEISESPLKKRKSTRNSPHRFQCPYCNSQFTQKSSMKTHVNLKHEDQFESTDFSRISPIDIENMTEEKVETMNPEALKNDSLIDNKKRKSVENSENISAAKRFKCPYCETIFTKKCNMKTHVKLKHDEKFESTDFSLISSIDNQTMSDKKEDHNKDDFLTSESSNRKRKSAEISSENVKKSRRISNAPKKFADFEMGNEENQPPPTDENVFEPDQENSPKDLLSPHLQSEMVGPTNQNVVTLMQVMSEDDL